MGGPGSGPQKGGGRKKSVKKSKKRKSYFEHSKTVRGRAELRAREKDPRYNSKHR